MGQEKGKALGPVQLHLVFCTADQDVPNSSSFLSTSRHQTSAGESHEPVLHLQDLSPQVVLTSPGYWPSKCLCFYNSIWPGAVHSQYAMLE